MKDFQPGYIAPVPKIGSKKEDKPFPKAIQDEMRRQIQSKRFEINNHPLPDGTFQDKAGRVLVAAELGGAFRASAVRLAIASMELIDEFRAKAGELLLLDSSTPRRTKGKR